MLKSGGIFARFANHPYKDKKRINIHHAFEKIYAKYMPGALGGKEYSEEKAENIADIAYKYGFKDISYALYNRTRTFTASEYIQLLGTYSDHIAIEDSIRMKFFHEIREAINDNGGYEWIVGDGNTKLNTENKWDHGKFLEKIDGVVMGSKCYDQGFHKEYKEKEVYIATSKNIADYENYHFINGDICKTISDLWDKG